MGKNQLKYLRVGAVVPKHSGIPLLPPFYAYLLKLSSQVGLVDIYPLLAEIIFHSDVVTANNGTETVGVPNILDFFIDDQKDNIANAMARNQSPRDKNGNYMWHDDFARYCWDDVHKKGGNLPRIFMVDTYGRFSRQKELNDRLEHSVGLDSAQPGHTQSSKTAKIPLYTRSPLAGAGNPARMLQKFSALGRLEKVPAVDGEGEGCSLGELNVYVFNSITYLTRTIGFREAMQLIRTILEQGVWKPNPDSADSEQLKGKDGLLFAILHEGVHTPDQIRYAETFFDGIIAFDVYRPREESRRRITYAFEQFPLTRASGHGTASQDGRNFTFEPNYACARCYAPRGGCRLLGGQKLDSVPRVSGKEKKSPDDSQHDSEEGS